MYPSNPHCKVLCGKDQIIPPGDLVPYIDIIIFAVIAVLLVLRLRSVLGQRTGYDAVSYTHLTLPTTLVV